MPILHAVIPGQPIGKGRPRFAMRGKGTNARPAAYTPEPTRRWESIAADTLRAKLGTPMLAEPCGLLIVAVMPRPQAMQTKRAPEGEVPHTHKPDWDNIGKIVSDALQLAGVLADDLWVIDGRVRRVYAAKGGAPEVRVTIMLGADLPKLEADLVPSRYQDGAL